MIKTVVAAAAIFIRMSLSEVDFTAKQKESAERRHPFYYILLLIYKTNYASPIYYLFSGLMRVGMYEIC